MMDRASIADESAGRLAEPYRRHDTRMDRCLLRCEVEFVDRVLGGAARTGTLLDLCCATGEVALMLPTAGFRTLGLDANRRALAAFRERAPDAPLVQGDALRLPVRNESLDVVVALHCFDLLDRAGFLRECGRVLKSGGLLIFDALNRDGYKVLLKRLGRLAGPPAAARPEDKWIDVLSFGQVRQLIGPAGFELLAASGYGWPPFAVSSDSRLVDAAAAVERALRLDRLPPVSPRTVMAVRKRTGQGSGGEARRR